MAIEVEVASRSAVAVAAALIGKPVRRLERVGGGRNSRVYRVEVDGSILALKQYPSRADDPRDRLGTEVDALRWMADHEIGATPRVVATDPDSNYALLTWAEGALPQHLTTSDIDQAVEFLRRLHALKETSAFSSDRLAAEACLSGVEIERQVRARVAHLRALPDAPALQDFLRNEFFPTMDAFFENAKRKMQAGRLSFQDELPHARRSLIPSDFGFHNALRSDNGRLTFIDFEYFGWDDPVKLTADVLLHPGTPVPENLRQRFRQGAENLYGDDEAFGLRLDAFYPLFGLRWVLILLNEFHPERWRRRLLAGASEDWEAAKSRQLKAAGVLLDRLKG